MGLENELKQGIFKMYFLICLSIKYVYLCTSKIILNLLKKMKNQYETVFIITPLVTEGQLKETVARIRDLMTNNGAEIVFENNWGLRKLAYPIKKKTTGYYQLIEFRSEPDFIQRLETEYNREEKIIRYLTTKLDKFAVEYNQRKQKEGKIQNPPKEENLVVNN